MPVPFYYFKIVVNREESKELSITGATTITPPGGLVKLDLTLLGKKGRVDKVELTKGIGVAGEKDYELTYVFVQRVITHEKIPVDNNRKEILSKKEVDTYFHEDEGWVVYEKPVGC